MANSSERGPRTVLITGATGFVGRHLVVELERAGFEVWGGSRSPERARRQFPGRRFRRLELDEPRSIVNALRGCDAAVYLVHGMASKDGGDYEAHERKMAAQFVRAAERAGVRRIVYLGGARPSGKPSKHLRSRLATGEILRKGAITTVELQASMIIGDGGESWTIVRDLALRLPVMILPKWLRHRSQPIAIDDVTYALRRALELDLPDEARVVEALPGPEVLSGRAILERIAALRGIRPWILEVPLLSPRLSSHWIALVTRADARVARELVEGLSSDLLAPGSMGGRGFWLRCPERRRMGFDEAARRALVQGEDRLSRTARVVEGVLRVVARRSGGGARAVVRRS
jgi:uncharacterized protein YbjT (DUF2867 family)